VREVVVAVALHEACNGSHKLGERNNAPTLKMEKWNGDATVLWVVGKNLLNLLLPIDQTIVLGRRPKRLSSRLSFSCDGENTTAASIVNQ
jgi:hypothetical protein